jgi:hypothetical protein
MGEYEPRDSRNVTQKQNRAPGEPPRTGPREDQARAGRSELEGDERGEEAENEPVRNEAARERPPGRQR